MKNVRKYKDYENYPNFFSEEKNVKMETTRQNNRNVRLDGKFGFNNNKRDVILAWVERITGFNNCLMASFSLTE